MKFFTNFIIYFIFWGIFYWIIKKINLRSKLLNIFKNTKHPKVALTIVMILCAFLVEYGKFFLEDLYGKNDYIRLMSTAISFNLIMIIVEGK